MATSNWIGGGDIRVTAAGQQATPAATALTGGGYVIGWVVSGTSGTGDLSEVHAQRFDASGAKLVGELLLSQGPAYGAPSLAGGDFVASWVDSLGQGQPQVQTVYAQGYDSQGNPSGSQVTVGTSLATAAHHTLTATADGGAVFAWDDTRTDGGDVYAERFAPTGAGDVAAPTVVAFSPADEAVNVPVASNASPDSLGRARSPRVSGVSEAFRSRPSPTARCCKWLDDSHTNTNTAGERERYGN